MLTINPNTPQTVVIGQPLCFEGSGVMSIPQEDLRPINIPSSGTHWTYSSASQTYVKTSGASTYDDAIVIADTTVYGLQPFYIRGANTTFTTPGAPNNNVSWFIGVLDNADNRYWVEVAKYCTSNTSTCGASTGGAWVMRAYRPGTLGPIVFYEINVNFNEIFFVRSDGLRLYIEHISGGNLISDTSIELPNTSTWRFVASAGFVGNQINFLATFKGSYQGSVPITWTAPDGGTLEGTPNAQCFTADVAGAYTVCIDSDFDEPLCVDVEADELFFDSIGLNCNECVFVNDVVHFESNGGTTGTLTVVDEDDIPAGTVIDALTWQAPSAPGTFTVTYTLDEDSVDCIIKTIPEFEITNIEGDTILGLVPGDVLKLENNYAEVGGDVEWENLNCDNLVSPDGYLTIPKNYRNSCFGAVDCYIRVKVTNFPSVKCHNFSADGDNPIYRDFRVIVDPVYPTPDFGGPIWMKWKPETPDFRVLTKTMEGGCMETHIRNRVPVQRWTVNYSGRRYDDGNPCDSEPCCDDPIGFPGGIDPRFQTAKLLDDFWMLVAGQFGYFTLVDPRTGYIWRKVRFEGKMERDHINWRHIQSRTFTLIWNPCCATEPAGGVCPHQTIKTDTYPPSVPQNVEVTPLAYSRLRVMWEASTDNIGVQYYELSIDSQEPINVGNVLVYYNKGLTPTTTHFYKVRAVDFSGNQSDWSDIGSGTTFDNDQTPPSVPASLRTTTLSDTELLVEWDASTDNVSVAGYLLLVDGLTIDVGNVLSYDHTGLEGCTDHAYSVRAYDTSNRRSHWSSEVIGLTSCGQVYEGTDTIIDGTDNVIEG